MDVINDFNNFLILLCFLYRNVEAIVSIKFSRIIKRNIIVLRRKFGLGLRRHVLGFWRLLPISPYYWKEIIIDLGKAESSKRLIFSSKHLNFVRSKRLCLWLLDNRCKRLIVDKHIIVTEFSFSNLKVYLIILNSNEVRRWKDFLVWKQFLVEV